MAFIKASTEFTKFLPIQLRQNLEVLTQLYRQKFCKLSASLFSLLFIATGCSGWQKPAPQVLYIQELLESYGREMEVEYALVFQGCGSSMPGSFIEEVEVLFEAHRKGSLDEARTIQVQGTERLLQKINNSERLKPYLKQSPFPARKVSLSISYSKDGKTRFSDGSIALAYKIDNQIFYSSYDLNSNSFQNLFSESYTANSF